eukprot:CAMPEP_0183299910 /NCGR_PEP_ID=MMETSP0160_2-20130417/6496_1 /TAXON_ID=2839 ORGANISM="Odontella Sinensis, Strain Grunow 1884" /NCGR_SAMPLE_ID=MMETSP0160_2 /ASSEMBLY_ACC=CAM_ASM_000250 /LENGTH=306 /DNA_ID=CAMNT_0025462235 /DNA_START=147 /DNA_END=1067 /DNA_ORIENTATION=+
MRMDREREFQEMVVANRLEVKRSHFEKTGVELTDEDIDEAIERERERHEREGIVPRKVFTENVTGFEHLYEPDFLTSRKLQTIGGSQFSLVSARSPGWSWNRGRNEFYCMGISDVNSDQLPDENTPLTLHNCLTTPKELISMRYVGTDYITFDQLDTTFFDWCISAITKKKNNGYYGGYYPIRGLGGNNNNKKKKKKKKNGGRKSKRVVVQSCSDDPYQAWWLRRDDSTFRLQEDVNLCVTASRNAGQQGGGKLTLERCEFRIRKKSTRQAQSWIACRATSNCVFENEPGGLLRSTCNFDDQCLPP